MPLQTGKQQQVGEGSLQRPLAFLGNKKNKVESVVKKKERKNYQIQLAKLAIISVQNMLILDMYQI